jgi:glycosyltransferase involved in cell wall biosynthesis
MYSNDQSSPLCFKVNNLRVLHIGEVAGLGGLQNWVCSLAEAQARRGYEVELMQPPWVAVESQVFTDLPVHTWDLGMTRNFDIVHTHGVSGYQNRKIQTVTPRPIVHTYYGTIVGIHIALRWFQNFFGWNGLGVPRNIVREAAGGRAADAVIAISPKVRSEIKRFYLIGEKKISVIPGGYFRDQDDSPKESLRRALGLPESGFLFLFVGRDDPVKNFSGALAAYHSTRSRFPDSYLVLAPKQNSARTDGVIGVELAPQKMSQLYRSVDALIHPGFYDGYSLAVHEALANGLPVVVGRNTGIADYCLSQVNALVLPRKRGLELVHSLSQMMCSLVESDHLRFTLGREAARIFGAMDWDWVAAETERVYSSL